MVLTINTKYKDTAARPDSFEKDILLIGENLLNILLLNIIFFFLYDFYTIFISSKDFYEEKLKPYLQSL